MSFILIRLLSLTYLTFDYLRDHVQSYFIETHQGLNKKIKIKNSSRMTLLSYRVPTVHIDISFNLLEGFFCLLSKYILLS